MEDKAGRFTKLIIGDLVSNTVSILAYTSGEGKLWTASAGFLAGVGAINSTK
jgi:hypothetical protein